MKRQAVRHKREKAAGFSLLEVLVAATLMGLMLVVILQVLTSALRAQEASRRNTQAVLVAENVLEDYGELRNYKEGTFQGREGRFDYLVRVVPQFHVILPASQDKQLICYLVQVTVSWEERGKVKSLELHTLRTETLKK